MKRSDLFHKYHCAYRYTIQHGSPRHSYEIVGPLGGLHLHITDHGHASAGDTDHRYSAGIEIHYRHARFDRAPDHDVCWLLKCPCWHDGSTTYAEEHWVPRWQNAGGDHDSIFDGLCREAERRFAPESEEEP